jgi:hypothetical protein
MGKVAGGDGEDEARDEGLGGKEITMADLWNPMFWPMAHVY